MWCKIFPVPRNLWLVYLVLALSACANPTPSPSLPAPGETVPILTASPVQVESTSLPTPTKSVPAPPAQPTRDPGFILLPMESIAEEVNFPGFGGVQLAGQFDFPLEGEKFDLVFMIHHSGAVERDSYQYLAARLVPLGLAVFRFDKRGTGSSGGAYGCCEAEDALAAYQAAVNARPEKIEQVFIIAQSIGTHHLASQFSAFQAVRQPDGVLLLSSLLSVEEVLQIEAPLRIVMSDSEPDQIAVSEAAVLAHNQQYSSGASLVVAQNTEHTLFDISKGAIDWDDPSWSLKFSEQAWEGIREWLEEMGSG